MSKDILVVSGLPTPNPAVMGRAVELLGADADVFTLDDLPGTMSAERSKDLGPDVTDAQIDAYLRHADSLFPHVSGLVVVNPDTEVVRTPDGRQQGDMRITNSVGRIAFRVMQRVAPHLQGGELQLTHVLPQRIGDATRPGVLALCRTIDAQLVEIRDLRPRVLNGVINGTKLANGNGRK